MIEKHTFVDIIESVKKHYEGQKALEKALNCYFEDDNFIFRLGCDIIDSLSSAFFTSDQIDFINNNKSKWGCQYHLENTTDWVPKWETVGDLICHFCWNGDFGENTDVLKDRMIIKDKDGNIIRSFNATTSEELFDLIMTYLSDEYNGYETPIYIDLTT
jgi:hypothetical protein